MISAAFRGGWNNEGTKEMKRMMIAAACAAVVALSGCARLQGIGGGGFNVQDLADIAPKDVKNIRIHAEWEDAAGAHVKDLTFRQSDTPSTNTPPVVTNAPPVTPPVVTNAPPVNGDAFDLSGAVSSSKHRHTPANLPVTVRLKSASIQGSSVRLSFDPIPWKTKTDEKKKKTTDGGVCIAWTGASGTKICGWFDWHGVNQTVKGMENIQAGYMDGLVPPDDADVFFYMTDIDLKERTNVVPGGKWKTFKLAAGFALPED